MKALPGNKNMYSTFVIVKLVFSDESAVDAFFRMIDSLVRRGT